MHDRPQMELQMPEDLCPVMAKGIQHLTLTQGVPSVSEAHFQDPIGRGKRSTSWFQYMDAQFQ